MVATLAGGLKRATLEPGPALPREVPELLKFGVVELAFFAAFWVVAWLLARPTKTELGLRWRGAKRETGWGIFYFLILRLGPIILVMGLMAVALTVAMMLGYRQEDITHAVQEYQKHNVKPERMVSQHALRTDPIYMLVVTTFVSFIVAGLREELWRTFSMTAMNHLFPRHWKPTKRAVVAVSLTAVIFGLGHYSVQGMLGVIVTTLLGLVLGTAIVHRKSIWPAVIAHGLFDATTFLAISLLDLNKLR